MRVTSALPRLLAFLIAFSSPCHAAVLYVNKAAPGPAHDGAT